MWHTTVTEMLGRYKWQIKVGTWLGVQNLDYKCTEKLFFAKMLRGCLILDLNY